MTGLVKRGLVNHDFVFAFYVILDNNFGLFTLKNKIVALHASLIIYSRCYQKEKTHDQLPLLFTNMHRCIIQGHAFYHGLVFL